MSGRIDSSAFVVKTEPVRIADTRLSDVRPVVGPVLRPARDIDDSRIDLIRAPKGDMMRFERTRPFDGVRLQHQLNPSVSVSLRGRGGRVKIVF